MPDVPIEVPDLARQSPLFIVRHFAPACYLSATLAMGCAMRNINLWTIVICLAGGWYVAKYYPGNHEDTNPMGVPMAQQHPTAVVTTRPQAKAPEPPKPAPVVAAQPEYQPAPAPVPEPPKQVGTIDPWTAELARQADARIARQRGEWAAQDQQAAQVQVAQANAAASTCAAWRNEKEAAVANLRRGGDAQWMNFWNQRLHAATDALYRNHC